MGRLIVLALLATFLVAGCSGGGNEESPPPDAVQPVGDRQTQRGVPPEIQKQSQIAGGMTK